MLKTKKVMELRTPFKARQNERMECLSPVQWIDNAKVLRWEASAGCKETLWLSLSLLRHATEGASLRQKDGARSLGQLANSDPAQN